MLLRFNTWSYSDRCERGRRKRRGPVPCSKQVSQPSRNAKLSGRPGRCPVSLRTGYFPGFPWAHANPSAHLRVPAGYVFVISPCGMTVGFRGGFKGPCSKALYSRVLHGKTYKAVAEISCRPLAFRRQHLSIKFFKGYLLGCRLPGLKGGRLRL